MLATSYLRLLPTLTLHDADVSKLLLSSQNASKFYLQYFQNCEVILNEHSVEILDDDDELTSFVDDNPDRSIVCLALFVTTLRLSVDIPVLKEFFVLLGRAKRLTSLVADGGHQRAGVRNASDFLANHSLPELKSVTGPAKLFCPSKTPPEVLNSCDTVLYTEPHNLPHGSMDLFIRGINRPAVHAKKMIWNFDTITAISVTASLKRVTEPRNDVEELTLQVKRYTDKGVGALSEAVLKAFPNLKQFDCYFVLPFVDETDEDADYPYKNPDELALNYNSFVDIATKELLRVQAPHTVLNFYCHNDYALKVLDDDTFFVWENIQHNRPNFKLDKVVEPRKERYDPTVTRFNFENVNKQIAENISFDMRFQGKLVRWHNFFSPWQSPK